MQKQNNLTTYALLLGAWIACILGCTMPSNNPNQKSVQQNSRNAESSTGQTGANNWSYTETPDKMGRGSIKTASTTSLNTVSFDFPYQGPQNGRLILRTHPQHGKDVILSIERGQFLTGVDGCKVLVRFDDNKPETFWANGPADYSTTTIFLNGYSKFVTSLKRSKRVMIEAPFYQQGNQVFEFNVEGLDWENPDAKKAK
jgi:hypothetical protein